MYLSIDFYFLSKWAGKAYNNIFVLCRFQPRRMSTRFPNTNNGIQLKLFQHNLYKTTKLYIYFKK